MKTDAPAADRLAWARGLCEEMGLRRTPAREAVLEFFSTQSQPVTLAQVCEGKAVKAQCDPATVFRTLQTLEGMGLLRRIWLHERTPFFVLLFPGDHRDYVLCTGCGKVEETQLECPVGKLEKEVADKLGYTGLRHELGFYGVCPDCQKRHPAEPHVHRPDFSCCAPAPRRRKKKAD